MAEFKLGRIRFVWKAAWVTGATYYKDDVVRFGGKVYLCQIGHTASADFNTDLDIVPTKWNLMSDGQRWRDAWAVSTSYQEGDLVKYGGTIYICINGHTSAATIAQGLETNSGNWNQFAEGTDWKGVWTVSTRYKLNDIVRYGGINYICITGHTSAATVALGLENASANWQVYTQGQEYLGTWGTVPSTRYKLNDIVKYGAGLWICTTQHTAGATFAGDAANWAQYVEGFEYENAWNPATAYQPGDVVKYGGNNYIAKTQHTDSFVPSSVGSANWDLFSEGLSFQQSWAAGTSYAIGEVVTHGGNNYVAIADSPSATYTVTDATASNDRFTIASTNGIVVGMTVRFTGTTFGGIFTSGRYYVKTVDTNYITISTTSGGATFNVTANSSGTMTATVSTEPPNAACWAVISTGMNWRGTWADDTEYNAGDTVRYASSSYICILQHRSEGDDGSTIGTQGGGQALSRPDLDATGTYWNLVAAGSETSVLTTTGDLVYYGGAGPTRLPVGTEGQLLRVSSELIPEWVTWGNTDQVYYVAPQGEDRPYPACGNTIDKPWASIRYACEQVDRGPRNPNSQHLLELNRAFIQREISAWIRYQINNNISPFSKVTVTSITGTNTLNTTLAHGLVAGRTLRGKTTANGVVAERDYYVIADGLTNTAFRLALTENGTAISTFVNGTGLTINLTFDYDEYKCERDVGFIIDRLIWDLGHGGNLKTRAAAFSLLGAFGEAGEFSAPEESTPYVTLAAEAEEGVAAYEQLKLLVADVLANEAPTTIYQTFALDSTAIVTQYINTDYTAESGITTTTDALLDIIITALTDQDTDSLPERIVPNTTINVKTGTYREVLPIIVPAETVVIGDEVRSTNAGPIGSIIDVSDVKYSLGSLTRLETVVGQIILGTNVTESSGNTATQSAEFPFASSTEVTSVKQLVRMMQHQIDYRVGTTEMVSSANPTGYNSSFLSGFGDARTLLRENKEFIKEEITAFLTANYSSVKYSKTKCKRDVAFIIDAMGYDLTYGGTWATLVAGTAYFDGDNSASLQIDSTEIAATVAAYGRLKTVVQQIIANTTVTKSATNTAIQWTDSTNLTGGSAANATVGALVDIITNIIQGDSTESTTPQINITTIATLNTLTSNSHGLAVGDAVIPRITANGLVNGTKYWVVGTVTPNTFQLAATYGGSVLASFTNGAGLDIDLEIIDYPTATNGITSTTALIAAAVTLDAAQETIVTAATTYITTNFPALVYNSAKCERDVRLILEAVMFDFMFNSNFKTREAAYSYLRATAADVFTLNQKIATRASFTYVKGLAAANVGGDATAQARIETLMTMLDDIVFGATNNGSVCQTEVRAADYARLQLERNRDYLVREITAYGAATYTTTVTAATAATDVFTCASTSWMQRGAPIRFTGTIFGGISALVTYYVQNVVSATTFKISTTRDSNTAVDISSDGSGSMTVSLYYAVGSCERDVNAYLDAIKFDTQYPGNYKSRLAARYYANAVRGSLEEDMYYLRNGTGVRNQTLQGLTGDLLAPNAYGTSRVSAGAYCSLDPGWGPNDFRTWIIARSPYVQNVATFGYAAIGQKIDGALHAGGNDSIVSNDFTQIISDGIGAWVTNNGRAELVSVFSYYAHIGYLSENGGRIRGTNGNNSYGDFGSVAEGFDANETPIVCEVDNRAFNSTVGSVLTDGVNQVFQFEYDNAGTDYTEQIWSVSGGGSGAEVEQDEFRDGAVFQVRLIDNVDDSTTAPEVDGNFGGIGYLSNANTAQSGTTTQLTLAAVDDEITGAYVGMKLLITSGAGAGQVGIVASYTAATKVATVIKESTGAAGWDHVIPGTAIVSPDAASTYLVEPRVSFTSPTYTSTARTLATAQTYTDAVYSPTFAVYSPISGTTSGSGISATFTVVRKGTKYSAVNIVAAGTGYARLDTVTIAGTSLGGASTANDITITITAVSTAGAIQAFEFTGYGSGGAYAAISSGSRNVNISTNGTSWTDYATALPSTSNWVSVAQGRLTVIETAGSFVVGRAYQITTLGSTVFTSIGATVNIVGTYFVATGVGSGTGTATPIANHLVAVSSSTTVNAYSVDGGSTWTAGGALPVGMSGIAVSVAYGIYNGNGRWIAIGTTGASCFSTNGGVTWSAGGAMPSPGSGTYSSLAYGQERWVATTIGDAISAYSTDGGVTWTAGGGLPSSSNWLSVTYGANKFVAVSDDGTKSPAYSVNGGATWASTGVTGWLNQTVTRVSYGQGVFVACNSTSNDMVSSEDGINWTTRAITRASGTGALKAINGNPNQSSTWAIIPSASTTAASSAVLGVTAKARAYVADGKIFAIRVTEPGSSYSSAPTVTITDPNNLFEAPTTVRIGNGAMANPSFIARGSGFDAAIAEQDIGNGYADNFQSGKFMAVRRLTGIPSSGANVVFATQPNTVYKLVQVLSPSGSFDGARGSFFQLSPTMEVFNSPANGTAVTTRIRYSQVRLTGHDFLDIGTGNFVETNYPGLPTQPAIQANETVDSNGGRVFYTSTDQDGNFRVGELFTIEQSTGVATLNADAFNIAGLAELSLGNITLGGNSATVTEFSTDPFLTANSDNVVSTQRAIKSYISAQIGGGGASLNVNSIIAGFVQINGSQITTTTGGTIQMKATFNFQSGLKGYPIAWNYFLT
jgi:hypothetical protein